MTDLDYNAPLIKQGSVTELEKASSIMPEGSNKSRSHGSQEAQSQGGFSDVRSSVNCSNAGSKAQVDLALAEKRVELLTRVKERKLREFALKLDNEEAEARDEAELAEIRSLRNVFEGSMKGSVVEKPRSTAKLLDGHLGGRVVQRKSDDPSEHSCLVD